MVKKRLTLRQCELRTAAHADSGVTWKAEIIWSSPLTGQMGKLKAGQEALSRGHTAGSGLTPRPAFAHEVLRFPALLILNSTSSPHTQALTRQTKRSDDGV